MRKIYLTIWWPTGRCRVFCQAKLAPGDATVAINGRMLTIFENDIRRPHAVAAPFFVKSAAEAEHVASGMSATDWSENYQFIRPGRYEFLDDPKAGVA